MTTVLYNMDPLLIVNFGGPRNLSEVEPFLIELLTDRELIRTRLPHFLHNALFRRIARKRAPKIAKDYALIGGRSPIYEATERIATHFKGNRRSLTFHRYLPSTHAASLQEIETLSCSTLSVLPLFPQFSYATTGSIAQFFRKHLSQPSLQKLRWIKSYPAHPAFISAWQRHIRAFLDCHGLAEEETLLLFSAHGLPKEFVDEGDPYQSECEQSFREVLKAFPNTQGKLSYQSKFGRGEWLSPATEELSASILTVCEPRRTAVVFIPIAFTSDHIETLFEIEHLYFPLVARQGLRAFRCPALNLEPHWLEALLDIAKEPNLVATNLLAR